MSVIAFKIMLLGLILFCFGIFITILSKNIFKIFFGALLAYSSSLLALNCWKNPTGEILSITFAIIAPFFIMAGMFLTIKLTKKFNTSDISEIEKIAKGEK